MKTQSYSAIFDGFRDYYTELSFVPRANEVNGRRAGADLDSILKGGGAG